jgi:hypothetical protein
MASKFKSLLMNPLYIGIIVTVLVILFMFFIPDYSDIVIIAAYIFTICYIIWLKDLDLIYALILSFIFAVAWLIVGKSQYGYNRSFVVIAGYNIFPLLLWAIGLFGIYIIYNFIEKYFVKRGVIVKLFVYSSIFWVLLIFFESLAYHVLHVRNAMTGNYPGLPLCECIHAPLWMQIVYLSMGPIYFLVLHMAQNYIVKH